ncbi:endonuclease domain-containing protein [Zestomonas carbonaria]|uniref:DUF559 domain-containing protein n=1 Tax=Zestomonas carbonaria TaxID=2762745 RepID=A0A7U7EQ67_9GAMM|nr:endonuclease domain-containing protein [Pseudomonas carbonaria]CAD5109050.1 hypothetical protein PSEWESI4_03346 [Pseudomonas carbonaria]
MTRKKLPLDTEKLAFTRELRTSATDAENLLWRHLRARQIGGCKFRRQHPFPPYVLDFYCQERSLAIELDGGQHLSADGVRYDQRRDGYLRSKGIHILRFSSRDVMVELTAVLERILLEVGE